MADTMQDTTQTCSTSCAEDSSIPFAFDLRTLAYSALAILLLPRLATLVFLPILSRIVGGTLGWYLKRASSGRRAHLLSLMKLDQERFRDERLRIRKPGDKDDKLANVDPGSASANAGEGWCGVVGFLHPFCNAGGGGERVLWAAIRATQLRYPDALCVVYTGDHDVEKEAMIAKVKNRFNIHLHSPTIAFVYLSTRHLVVASTWPRFTLLGQSLGSIIMAWDAFHLVVPDIFIDTMGYAFALGFCRLLFRRVPTCAYVHYPTISTDMLESLDPSSPLGSRGVNAGQGTGLRGAAKKAYWHLFAALYTRVGATIDVVMTNSSWTQAHIQKLWGPHRKTDATNPIAVVFPPVAVTELEEKIDVSPASEAQREKILLLIAQFRPEKDHQSIIQSFAKFVKSGTLASRGARLVLVGSVRDDGDSKRVYQLRLLANELNVKDSVEFHLNASWPEILEWLRKSSVGVNGMWNEHFGIGVVEYQAAGLISVVHASGGPKMDIVVDVDGEPTGFHANDVDEFAEAFEKALSLPDPAAMRQRAQISARRFTEEEFARKWTAQMERLVGMLR
ncbi:probable GDP-Man:Man(3)GlcNAc(2)-PP-Dol alpha-1,2-mannosyltransferase [Cephalotrichum gorgonifer]|uniref:GDP-Man:Man(3)GlcNAc(2)-PP-Dol alpha-1,2-mannosyltransferase n=1 Tax=Cephalotrichum gorgonifer TaxID=2041049 RepID=A0AAE8N067_9PEZI|nr:probable GDP-Man:Man(3)GlcNAc(2)-PP-Dol alpha-1,2-mannosyltransferase [Cephalotrichum gorgonifer]